MTANYHTHTYRCKHAEGEMRQYVETAIERGLSKLGFSDHVPQPEPDGKAPCVRMRMSPSDTDGYAHEVLSLKKEYAKDIDIYLGFEAEYFRHNFQLLCRHLSAYPVDYLILGQHFVPKEAEGGFYIGEPHTDRSLDDLYTELTLEALETGLFSYLAHPDIPRNTDRSTLDENFKKICKRAAELDIPVELNLLGLSTKRQYPDHGFFHIAKETGCKVVIGCDAHSPDAVAKESDLILGKEFLDAHGIKAQEDIRLIKPDFTRWI